MTLRTSKLPEIEAKCPECGLRVMVSAAQTRQIDPASMCKHAPWERCPKPNLSKPRAAAQKLLRGADRYGGYMPTAVLACLSMIAVAQAADRPSPYLKGVTTVVYTGVFEIKGPCAIDRKAWNTAIEFVANQSSKLTLVTDALHQEQFEEMLKVKDKSDKTMFKKDVWTDEEVRRVREADAIVRKFSNAPHLSFIIETIEIEGGCVASVEADVKATLKSSEMISTGTIVYNPDYSLWSQGWKLKKTYQSFSRSAIEICEQTMKRFVNDWTASQNLP